jgi:hypothetical protein
MMLSDSIVVCSGSLGVKNSQESEGRNKEESAKIEGRIVWLLASERQK